MLFPPEECERGAGVSRRRFLKSSAAGGLWLAAGGLGLTAGSCTKSDGDIFNPDDLHVLWIAQTIFGDVSLAGDPVSGAEVTLEISNNVGAEGELWSPKGSVKTAPTGYYEFRAPSGGFFLIQPPINDPALSYHVWIRVRAGKSGVGFAEIIHQEVRKPSRTPPTGNLSPYQIQQNLILKPV